MKKFGNVKVENMLSTSGNVTPNQFIVTTPEGRYFQSYQTVIAFIANNGEVTMNEVFDHSTTTGKFRNSFLGDSGVAVTRKKVKSGEYKVANLNEGV